MVRLPRLAKLLMQRPCIQLNISSGTQIVCSSLTIKPARRSLILHITVPWRAVSIRPEHLQDRDATATSADKCLLRGLPEAWLVHLQERLRVLSSRLDMDIVRKPPFSWLRAQDQELHMNFALLGR